MADESPRPPTPDSRLLPLSGLKVVALEQAVAAPFCSRNLADMGADVVKIEPLEGDFARTYDTVVKGQSSYFIWLNRGKRSLAVNLRTGPGREILGRLLRRGGGAVSEHAAGAGR